MYTQSFFWLFVWGVGSGAHTLVTSGDTLQSWKTTPAYCLVPNTPHTQARSLESASGWQTDKSASRGVAILDLSQEYLGKEEASPVLLIISM